MEPVWTELVLICETLEVFFMHVRMKQDQMLLPAPAFCLESTEHEVIQSDYIITDPPHSSSLCCFHLFGQQQRVLRRSSHARCAASGCASFQFACTTAATRVAAGAASSSGTLRPDSQKRFKRSRKITLLLFPLMRLDSTALFSGSGQVSSQSQRSDV